ncbi:nucleobindin-2-like [Convolutriloba macropyga]|uniref:nucleobindin-2-like n=1 Tax=Convolutriloba macropyga TaxID=536237 RepID=UPI003F520184
MMSSLNSRLNRGVLCTVVLLVFVYSHLGLIDCRRIPRMHAENPNIRHVPRGPPPPHPGRLDKNPPPREKHIEPKEGDTLPADIAELSYEKYLREVTRILESDPDFKKKMENATREEVMSGKLSRDLEFASHHVRNQLDEAKRREIDRLRTDFKEMARLQNNDRSVHEDYIKSMTAHMNRPKDPKEFDKFTSDDLQQLIHTATRDLDAIDVKRREEFKKNEMRKELEHRRAMEKLSPEERAQKEREYNAQRRKLKEHPRMHEPGHKKNLEEVWEEQDHMDKGTFKPKTFFYMHDMNGDGRLDESELQALFVKEVDKMYAEAEKNYDDKEELERVKEEEMARMREHAMNEVDTNKDRSITWEEFSLFTQSKDFEKDDEWKGVPEQEQFTENDLKEYEQRLEKDMKFLQERKEKLRKYKEKMQMEKSKSQTKPPSKNIPGDGHVMPPPPDFYYNVDGEKLPNYDQRIEDYGDYRTVEFEG